MMNEPSSAALPGVEWRTVPAGHRFPRLHAGDARSAAVYADYHQLAIPVLLFSEKLSYSHELESGLDSFRNELGNSLY